MPPTPQGDSTNAKQLIVDRIRQATNILVAVSANPSIDALAAALGLTLTLNKLDKHATAVFSGQVPPVMQFLNPEKTFEDNVDSLRDFIISLDKDKADRLRYKLEKDVVRIFITPYRTTITEKDLQFSQGDFNVDLIIGLGVEKREDLDKTIVAHGRILHDAAVVTINANGQQSTLGAVDWHDPASSSMCEMLVALTEALQKPGLLDAQIATALLTGIVAATDRFSNQHTTPKVMTMSAQLMAAGADQQLVATNIQKTDMPLPEIKAKPEEDEDALVSEDGQLSIKHPDVDTEAKPAEDKAPVQPDIQKAEDALESALPKPAEPDPLLDNLKAQLEDASKSATAETSSHKFVAEPPSSETGDMPDLAAREPDEDKPSEPGANSWQGRRLEPLAHNADANTSATGLEAKLQAEEEERNQKVLSHQAIEPLSHDVAPVVSDLEVPPTMEPAATTEEAPVTLPAEPTKADLDAARQAVDGVYATQPFDPAGQPSAAMGATDVQPYIPLQPTIPPPPTQGVTIQPPQGSVMPSTTGGLPIIPPMPSLPVQEPGMAMTGPPMPPPLPPTEAQPPSIPPQPSTDPGQFKIPGQ